MNSGDLIACGTNHEGLGFLQDGETVDIEIQNIGKMTLKVRDPLKRTWETRRLHGRRFHQSGRRQAPSPAGRPDGDGRDLTRTPATFRRHPEVPVRSPGFDPAMPLTWRSGVILRMAAQAAAMMTE